MKAEEKKIVYRFFLTASAFISGFKAEETEPFFLDDIEDAADGAVFSQTGGNAAVLTLAEIYTEIKKCKACRLCGHRKNAVPGEGPQDFKNNHSDTAGSVRQNQPEGICEDIEVMVIGEGPGADEDAQGRPFVGRAGQLLDKMLAAIDLFRTRNCYIANVVKCRPPGNRDPLPDETAACRHFLDNQIKLIKPKAILIVGRIALQNILQTAEGIGKMHGRFLEYGGIPVMATYHPSALLRNENLKRPAWEDLKLFRTKLNEIQNRS